MQAAVTHSALTALHRQSSCRTSGTGCVAWAPRLTPLTSGTAQRCLLEGSDGVVPPISSMAHAWLDKHGACTPYHPHTSPVHCACRLCYSSHNRTLPSRIFMWPQGAGLGLFLRQRPRLPWTAWLRGALGAEPDALLASFPAATAITPALITRQPGLVSASMSVACTIACHASFHLPVLFATISRMQLSQG